MKIDPDRLDAARKAGRLAVGAPNRRACLCVIGLCHREVRHQEPGFSLTVGTSVVMAPGSARRVVMDGMGIGYGCADCTRGLPMYRRPRSSTT